MAENNNANGNNNENGNNNGNQNNNGCMTWIIIIVIIGLISALIGGQDGDSSYGNTHDGYVGDNDRDHDVDDDDFEAEWDDYVGDLLEGY